MHWNPIGTGDYPRLAPYFQKQSYRLSAYSLASVIVWNHHGVETFYAMDNETLILADRAQTPLEEDRLLLPIGSAGFVGPDRLAAIARQAAIPRYWFVPEAYLEAVGYDAVDHYFNVMEQRGFNDYLYRTEDMALLKGNRYAGKRNWINRFWKVYRQRVLVESIDVKDIDECLAFLEEWCQVNDCGKESNEGLFCEKQATIQALRNIDRLGFQGILVRIDGKVAAFGICSGLTEDIGILSFEKANADIEGLYQFLDNECAKRLFTGYRFINKESDMGLPGLAKSKQSYHPMEMVKSYCLTLKE